MRCCCDRLAWDTTWACSTWGRWMATSSMTSYESVPCAHWDPETGEVMSHSAFQPFRWPFMRDDPSVWRQGEDRRSAAPSPGIAWMQISPRYDGAARLHEWRARHLPQGDPVRACHRGHDLLWMESGGGQFWSRWSDLRLCRQRCGSLQFRDPHDSSVVSGCNLHGRWSTRVLNVPATWLTLSLVSGPMLIQNARWCRERNAPVQGPDQTMQMSQLAGIHAHWMRSFHIALQCHNPEQEKKVIILPPVLWRSGQQRVRCRRRLWWRP